MKHYRILVAVLTTALLVNFLCGCQNEQSPTNSDDSEIGNSTHQGSMQKLGSPIQFSHTYDGQNERNQVESFEIELVSGAAGLLNVQLTSDQSIFSDSNTFFSKNVAAEEQIVIPVAIRLTTPGKYYVNVQADLAIDGNVQRKVFTFAVKTDTTNIVNSKTLTSPEKKPDVVVMPAKENVTVE